MYAPLADSNHGSVESESFSQVCLVSQRICSQTLANPAGIVVVASRAAYVPTTEATPAAEAPAASAEQEGAPDEPAAKRARVDQDS